jgi:hypothetical protein
MRLLSLSRCTGQFAAPHAGWEALCPDIQRLVLSKLSLRELACAARACRGFREAYLRQAAEERANLIALANVCYGERFTSNIVRAVRRSLRGLDPYPGLVSNTNGLVRIDANGEASLVDTQERMSEGHKGQYSRESGVYFLCGRDVGLFPSLSREAKSRRMFLGVNRDPGRDVELLVTIMGDMAGATKGVLLAICTEDSEADVMRPPLFNLTVKSVEGGGTGRRSVQDLVAPLRRLGNSCGLPPGHASLMARGRDVQGRPQSYIIRLKLSWPRSGVWLST